MAFISGRGHEALRRGRLSVSGAEYFLTFCTKNRTVDLLDPAVLPEIFSAARRLELEKICRLHTAVVMPDHLHVLVSIGELETLGGFVRLFKGRLTPVLRKQNLHWQPAFFDHRMRSEEDRLPVFHYIFMNPYRSELLSPGERWAGYFCSEEDWAWFGKLTGEDHSLPEWLA